MKQLLASLCASLLLAAAVVQAQSGGIPAINSQAPFLAAALSEFFSDTRAFTAGAELALPTKEGGESLKLPFGVAMADGQMRWELNLANVKSAELPPEALTGIKEMGLDRMAFIYIPSKPLTLLLPGMKTYIENYADTMQVNRRRNRKRYSKAKTFALRIVSSLAIAALVYWTMKR